MHTEIFSLADKTALITGSSRGLGLVMARGLMLGGAKVILNGRNEALLQESVSALKTEGGEVDGVVMDVCSQDSVASAVAEIESEHGVPDILINNAGIQRRGELVEMKLDDWQDVVATNLTAPFLVSKHVAPGMIRRKQGKIINICSLMSEVGRATTGPYTAAKGGLKMLTRAMAIEWARYNIQVNAIGPGYFATEMTKPLVDDQNFSDWVKQRTPAQRWGNPQELIGAAIFLASEASSFVNGQVIYVDGGILAGL